MRKQLQFAAMIAAFSLLTIGAAVCPAQSDIIVGGYGEASTSDGSVVEAANFAVAAQNKSKKNNGLKLHSILRAELQIVAGVNFRMCLSLMSNDNPRQASATVYRDLQNQFSLSNWTEGNCGGKEGDEMMEEPAGAVETFAGMLDVGKTESVILYFGEESGDYAAFCFPNDSPAGRAILAACKNGEKCEFTGLVNYESGCKVKNLEADLSAAGTIISIESVRSMAAKKEAKNSLAPNVIVKNLYAAEKAGASPFFQTKDRALVDMYFEDDLADLIWNDAVKADGEVGALGFDPLYNAQDTKITGFAIGKPEYDKVSEITTVSVKFKNFGKAETIKYFFEQDQTGNWKILDIVYKDGKSVKSLLFDAQLGTEKMQ